MKILFDFESKIFEGGGGNESFIVGYDLVNWIVFYIYYGYYDDDYYRIFKNNGYLLGVLFRDCILVS